jgi:hypothetical protein
VRKSRREAAARGLLTLMSSRRGSREGQTRARIVVLQEQNWWSDGWALSRDGADFPPDWSENFLEINHTAKMGIEGTLDMWSRSPGICSSRLVERRGSRGFCGRQQDRQRDSDRDCRACSVSTDSYDVAMKRSHVLQARIGLR